MGDGLCQISSSVLALSYQEGFEGLFPQLPYFR
jgi:hypothetical protein